MTKKGPFDHGQEKNRDQKWDPLVTIRSKTMTKRSSFSHGQDQNHDQKGDLLVLVKNKIVTKKRTFWSRLGAKP